MSRRLSQDGIWKLGEIRQSSFRVEMIFSCSITGRITDDLRFIVEVATIDSVDLLDVQRELSPAEPCFVHSQGMVVPWFIP